MPFDPARVDCWIFDLDNTLYPASVQLFDQIDVLMGRFIAELLGCDLAEARRVQKMYFHDHGTTLAGLMHYHAVDPRDFLSYVHAIDMGVLSKAPRIADKLRALPGQRLIFTNADGPYAERVLDALGITDCFDGMWDIHAMEYRPKPEMSAYTSLVERFGIDPERAVFVEDSARNLSPAKGLGMQTVWIDMATDWGDRAKDDAAIDLVIDDLERWLDSVAAELARPRPLG
ncbi:pyrimidine 5-nucleotidase [Novosphingobium nitrogenifigens DSM 19370]|uniref:Pyrimidine 5-nucleotidase n=1 Tax=Novosphingobium nitrogenifigens DSM 19370 TaxID=983920 RepID=F1ZA41_9SPHN|nr:pyrimidine 5'-nucleotidase [Novosphingobium nitrogenifigens]EGD58552.1 pyrimidine 5-nucleotidase [Novosphingobium nitrogenifigens DSM 19370]